MRGFGIVLLLAAAPGAVSAAGDSATDWLMRMNRAAESLSYQGTFVYLHDNQVETMWVARKVEGGSLRERLLALNGEPREIIRDDRQVWCYLPDRSIGVHEYRQVTEKNFPALLPDELSNLARLYDVHFGEDGHHRLAGREARHIVVEPRDQLRYGYELWVDTQTGLLLRAVLTQPDGQPIEQYLFTRIDVETTVPARALKPSTPREALKWYGTGDDQGDAHARDLAWEVTAPPEGFRVTRQIRRSDPMSGEPVEHLVLSDGLAAVSVFVTGTGGKEGRPLEGVSRMGAVHAFGRMIGAFQVTVVGEVPAETVQRIGEAVRRR